MAFGLRASSPVIVNDTAANAFTDLSLLNTQVGDGIPLGTAIGNNTSTISSITISGESNATMIGTLLSVPGGQRNQLAYLGTCVGSGTKAIHITYSAFSFAFSSFAMAVNAAIDLDDADQTAAGDTLSMTAAVANTMAVALATDGNTDPSLQSGYTDIPMLDVASYTRGQYNMDLGASGAKTVQMTGAAFQSIIAAIFKPAGGAAAANILQPWQQKGAQGAMVCM